MKAIDLSAITQSEKLCSFLGIKTGSDIDFEVMGHGEYNLNYLFSCPTSGKKLVLRIPMGSQMHLANQVRYEFEALQLLKPSGRTPDPLYIDDTRETIPYGFMVMDFLPGRPLRYEDDLEKAAECLADIHNLEISADCHLIAPENPLGAILEECHEMFAHYLNCDYAAQDTKHLISELLKRGEKILEGAKESRKRRLINTELNSRNFLVNDGGTTYLVDWEKPLRAYPAQDLGHFLAPTTTFWKTDSILTESEINGFLRAYCKKSADYPDPAALWDETLQFFTMNCLRGVTWCAMAWVEYQSPDRMLKDEYTFEKIKRYISPEFIERIRIDYLGD